jgi:hypothetical protein
MSAPDTNVEKQARRHKPALYGIALAVLVAVVAIIVFATSDGLNPADQAAPATVPAADQ